MVEAQRRHADGRFMSKPYAYYMENREFFQYTKERLETLKNDFLSADRDTQKKMVHDATEMGLISANLPVERFERVYNNTRGCKTFDEYHDAIVEESGGYQNNRSKWMVSNRKEDFGEVVDMLENNQLDNAQNWLVDHISGLSWVKSAFTIAMMGFTDKMCVDTNVMQSANVTKEQVNKVRSVEQYETLCDVTKACYKDLSDELSPFMFQWVMFDEFRGSISAHDPWFMNINKFTN